MICSRYALHFIIFTLLFLTRIFACDGHKASEVAYPIPANFVDKEIDRLLMNSEERLFIGDFREGLFQVERAESLLSLTNDPDDYRRLRCLFDKALLVTCEEGPSDNSRSQFEKFSILLSSKSCKNGSISSEENLFDKNGHWPIVDDGPISIGECISRVESIESKLEKACLFLSLPPKVQFAVQSAIVLIGDSARLCCTKNGFWKTCIQPVVDAWKRTEIFGIPPDPYWD